MRQTRPRWPRLAGFLILAVLLWWGVGQLSPSAGALERLSFQKVTRALGGDLRAAPGPRDDEGRLVMGGIKLDAGPGCEELLAHVAHAQTVARGDGVGTLSLRCDRAHGEVFAAGGRTDPGAPTSGAPRWEHRGVLPNGLSLLPPLFVVLLAFFTGHVLASLFAGVVFGALLVDGGDAWLAATRTAHEYLWQGATDPFNLYIFGFTLVLIGTVHVAIAMGGMQGIIDAIGRGARTARSTQVAAALMGVAIFFDDYANTVIVGSSARPLTDARRVSREKLAYIVDSTAAPVAGVAVISTWIGYEVGLFNQQLDVLGPMASGGYDFFFQLLPYRFYCYFALVLVFLVATTGRDFGPMRAAEERARRTGQVAPGDPSGRRPARALATLLKAGVRPRWRNGVLPIAVVLIGSFGGLLWIGARRLAERGDTVSWLSLADLGEAFTAVGDDNVAVLFWAAVAGSLVAFALALGQRLLTAREAATAWFRGVRAMLPAIVILILAVGIRRVTDDLGTDRFLAALLSDTSLVYLPVMSFLLAAAIAFATGTSWGTMGILLPVAVPLAVSLNAAQGASGIVVLLVSASVLDGAIFGDHCSLISDTTVMSSMASSCDHVQHVRTQLPYALLAMTAASSAYVLMAWHDGALTVWAAYALGAAILVAWLWARGRHTRPRKPAGEGAEPTA